MVKEDNEPDIECPWKESFTIINHLLILDCLKTVQNCLNMYGYKKTIMVNHMWLNRKLLKQCKLQKQCWKLMACSYGKNLES